MTILITGAAGFIGYNLSLRMIQEGLDVIGYDNLNNYYDINLKQARLKNLYNAKTKNNNSFHFIEGDLENINKLKDTFTRFNPTVVVNLAAQAGVRYSIENPCAYIQSNIVGFANILENCRHFSIKHLIFASSSSVYGGNQRIPFSEEHSVDHPISLYAASKKSNEVMAHAYSHLYNIPTTGLRFFTVYGPWGRPDMALFLFTKAILDNKAIKIYNHGNMVRDFTYIDDVIESIVRIVNRPAESDIHFNLDSPNPSKSWAKYRIFNVGNSKPVKLLDYIGEIEKNLRIKAKKEFLPMQAGDVRETIADNKNLVEWINFRPKTDIKDGIKNFIEWYKDYYKI